MVHTGVGATGWSSLFYFSIRLKNHSLCILCVLYHCFIASGLISCMRGWKYKLLHTVGVDLDFWKLSLKWFEEKTMIFVFSSQFGKCSKLANIPPCDYLDKFLRKCTLSLRRQVSELCQNLVDSWDNESKRERMVFILMINARCGKRYEYRDTVKL